MTGRERRAVIWGATILGLAFLGTRILPAAVRHVRHKREEAIVQQTTLARARAVLDEQLRVRDSLGKTLGTLIALAPKFIEGRSAAEAQASLSSLVTLEAGRQGLRLVRIDPLPDSALGLFSRVALRAELEGDIRGLTRVLGQLESGDPVLSVMSLAVQTSNPAAESEQLRIEMSIGGYYVPRSGR